MKTLALTSSVFVLTAASALAQQSDIEFLRARADAQERKIGQLERELNKLKAMFGEKQHPKAVPVPSTDAPAAPAAAPVTGEYTVVSGDTLSRIARKHKTTVAAIRSANGLQNDNIMVGQKLKISGAKAAPAVADKKPAAPSDEVKPVNTATKHVVKSGETFYSIARQHKVSVNSLMAANPAVSPTSLQVGKTLNIDGSARAPKKSVAKSTQSKPKAKTTRKEATKVAEHIDPPKAKKQPTKEVARKAPADRKPVSKKSEPEIRTVTVHRQLTYGQFASQYGASTSQLNALNGLSLSKNTMLAIGSELYVPKD